MYLSTHRIMVRGINHYRRPNGQFKSKAETRLDNALFDFASTWIDRQAPQDVLDENGNCVGVVLNDGPYYYPRADYVYDENGDIVGFILS